MAMDTFDGNIDNDLYIDEAGNLVVISDEFALADKLKQRLKLFYAEWFLATDRGVPYFENIFGANKNNDIVASIFTQEILKEPDVISVNSVSYELQSADRIFTYSASLSTIYGEQEFTFDG